MLFFSLAFFQDSARKTFLLYRRLPLQQVFTSLNSSSDLQGRTSPGRSPRPMQNTAAGKPGAARATPPASAQHLWSQVLLKKQGSGSGKGGVWAGLETPIQTLCQPAEEAADAPRAAGKTPQDFLTCRQAVLETLPATPSTTPWP